MTKYVSYFLSKTAEQVLANPEAGDDLKRFCYMLPDKSYRLVMSGFSPEKQEVVSTFWEKGRGCKRKTVNIKLDDILAQEPMGCQED